VRGFVDLLREHGVALVVSDNPGVYPVVEEPTAEEPEDPERITDRAPPRASSRDVYLYFDNDQKTRAPFDARHLMERLGLDDGYPEPGSREKWPD
jgi:hypothetical protein